ncbi:MAG: ApbE family lipoprotein [Verrucomicrobiales bacterium]|nr:ApbE family lipoprotein [Verrucomicrobiales bacterium]
MVLNAGNSRQEAITRVADSARLVEESGQHKLIFRAMSTECRVQVHGISKDKAQDFFREVVGWVAEFEAHYSRFIPDSLIGRINAAAGMDWVEIDPESERLFKFCQELVFLTAGAFDPTALPLIKLWNWKALPPSIPEEAAIRAARELVGWNKVQRRSGGIFLPRAGMCLDLGGIGKEYAVDRVVSMGQERAIPNVLVDFGHDVRVQGHAPNKKFWWIGLEDSNQPGKCWTGVAVTDKAVATSGDYVRHFEINGRRYGHIIDPRTGYPVDNGCHAVSVIAPSCTMAGVLSTSALILGAEQGLRLIENTVGGAGVITTARNRLCTRKFHEYAPPS